MRDDDIDDDDDAFDDDGILRDGRSMKVSINMMDSVQKAIAFQDHRPGFRHATDTDTRDAAEQSRDEYVRWLQGAHKTPVVVDAKPKPQRPVSLADAQQAASDAHAEYCQWLRDAHKQRPPRKLPYGWEFGDAHDR